MMLFRNIDKKITSQFAELNKNTQITLKDNVIVRKV